MPTLSDVLLVEPNRTAVIKDVAQMYTDHIMQLKGLKGMALRTGLSMFKAARPNAMEEAISRLIPESLTELDADFQAWSALPAGRPDFGSFLLRDPKAFGVRIMAVVDARVDRSNNPTLKSAFGKLRSNVSSEFEALAPQLARTIGVHVMKAV